MSAPYPTRITTGLRARKAPHPFLYVQATAEEVEAWRRKHNGRWPSQYRLECQWCGTRIWGSGLGIGSHRRGCAGAAEGFWAHFPGVIHRHADGTLHRHELELDGEDHVHGSSGGILWRGRPLPD